LGIHDYILELIKSRHVTVLYFSDYIPKNWTQVIKNLIKSSKNRRKFEDIPWEEIEFVFSYRELNRKADVILNLNMMYMRNLSSEFNTAVCKFDGLKIFHVGDYFWNRPGSEINRQLEKSGVDHLLGYAMHDRYCEYFQKTFPTFSTKVWGIPFGFSRRFENRTLFLDRLNKAVALGSVNPLRPLGAPVYNYRETADFFPDESWFHKFRRLLLLNKMFLTDVMDSLLPEFPQIKDFRYDLVAKFNEYRMFVTCESIFFFPSAKVFEGPACGTALLCSDHDCIREYGFEDNKTCIMHNIYDVDDFRDKVKFYQSHPVELSSIAEQGKQFVRLHYSHQQVAQHLVKTVKLIWEKGGELDAVPLAKRLSQ